MPIIDELVSSTLEAHIGRKKLHPPPLPPPPPSPHPAPPPTMP